MQPNQPFEFFEDQFFIEDFCKDIYNTLSKRYYDPFQLDHFINTIRIYIDELKQDFYKDNPELRPKPKTRKEISKSKAIQVMLKSNSECTYCKSKENLVIDHIIPIKAGGNNDIENLQILCRSCNAKKGSKLDFKPSNNG